MYNKTILIIGGTGTLGTALIDELIKQDVWSIRIFARDEYRMWKVKQKYEDHSKLRYFIGDIRDKDRLNLVFENVDIAINCAAMKHVSMCNESPFESLKTNVIGVQNALECAIKNNIKIFVQISTDKAVNPENIYGCTKLMSEYLVLDAPNWQGKNRTKFIIIRSGNIAESSGSVLEIWKNQYCENKPLTVTNLEAERYIASKEQIASAIIKIIPEASNGLYILNMPKVKVKDLLNQFDNPEIKITGLLTGEKMSEELYRKNEKCTIINVVENRGDDR